MRFQSTLPWGERHYWRRVREIPQPISIHALLGRATKHIRNYQTVIPYFNPRSPVESDSLGCLEWQTVLLFQSTLSWGERLARDGLPAQTPEISIHALLWRATKDTPAFTASSKFQSTLSWGERRRLGE